MAARIAWIAIAPVKKLALKPLQEVRLERYGVRENRRFYLIGAGGQLARNSDTAFASLLQVQADWDEDAGRLELRFPDGEVVAGEVSLDGLVETNFYGRPVAGRLVAGPWSQALSEFVGKELSLVQADEIGAAVDRGPGGPVSLVSTASLDALAAAAGEPSVDGRRFRMLFGIEGVAAYEEDTWLGRRVRLGDAVVVPRGNVGRCVVTTRNPETGESDLETLKVLAAHRRDVETTEPIPFGVWGEVAQPGMVRLGDEVSVS